MHVLSTTFELVLHLILEEKFVFTTTYIHIVTLVTRWLPAAIENNETSVPKEDWTKCEKCFLDFCYKIDNKASYLMYIYTCLLLLVLINASKKKSKLKYIPRKSLLRHLSEVYLIFITFTWVVLLWMSFTFTKVKHFVSFLLLVILWVLRTLSQCWHSPNVYFFLSKEKCCLHKPVLVECWRDLENCGCCWFLVDHNADSRLHQS